RGLRAARDHDIALWRWGLAAGVVTALGLLAKLTMVVTLPCTLLWLWWLAAGSGDSPTAKALRWRRFISGLLAVGATILLLVGWWVVRNILVYGEPTGTRAIFALYHTTYWSRQGFPLDQLFSFFPVDDFIIKTFRSFSASYGWVAVSLPGWVYALLVPLTVLGLAGLVRFARQ